MLQRREVPLQSQSRDARNCGLRRQALTSEWLSAVNVREVHLNRGNVQGRHRIPQRHRGVAESTWIEDDGMAGRRDLLQNVHQISLDIALKSLKTQAQFQSCLCHC